MMVILNPTDYDITVKWDGLEHLIGPDERKQIENDSMGKQIMHNYRARGLVDLYYGDEGDIELKKTKEGRKICDEFWTKQCISYNQDNERRQQTQRPFVKPQAEVQLHAQRLGIKLLEPYKLEDTSSKQISLLMDQNKKLEKELNKKDDAMVGLQAQVSELTDNFKKLMALAGGEPAKTEKVPADNGDAKFDELKTTLTKMPKKRFANWIVKNWTEIQSYPDDVRNDIAAKHESLFNKTMPTEQPVIDNYSV